MEAESADASSFSLISATPTETQNVTAISLALPGFWPVS